MGQNKKKNEVNSAGDRFQDFYRQHYKDRWEVLSNALTQDSGQIARPNKFLKNNSLEKHADSSFHRLSFEEMILPPKPEGFVAEIPRDPETGLLSYYIMDPASLWPVVALSVTPGMRVLDMCAAPGGKTLAIAEQLFLGTQHPASSSHSVQLQMDLQQLSADSELIANEPSESRRDRLTKVLRQYIPEHFRKQCRVTGRDGGLFALKEAEGFDRILVDAPCSGERHLLQNQQQLQEWSIQRSKGLGQRQYALLTSALICLKPAGRLVYSTCALSPFENDQVIEKLLKKKEGFRVIPSENWQSLAQKSPWQLPSLEPMEYGAMIFPDHNGYGPIYLSVLQKDE